MEPDKPLHSLIICAVWFAENSGTEYLDWEVISEAKETTYTQFILFLCLKQLC